MLISHVGREDTERFPRKLVKQQTPTLASLLEAQEHTSALFTIWPEYKYRLQNQLQFEAHDNSQPQWDSLPSSSFIN